MATITLATLAIYFLVLMLISRTSNRSESNDTFFSAGKKAPWLMVAFGMIGASISGVTMISVPGWVSTTGMTYLQMCAGFVVGYYVVATVLLPVYYKLKLTSIYGYLEQRFGPNTHKTGASFFLLSKLTGASARLYLVCLVIQTFVSDAFGIPFPATVALILVLIWLYTRRSGIATIVRTDVIQTACLLLATVGIFYSLMSQLNMRFADVRQLIASSDMNKVFDWDANSKQYFWRQFLSGMFITIVMTGLDQDMMQKNLTCSTLRDAKRNMFLYGWAFLPVNALFLCLGILLYTYVNANGLPLPERTDDLLPMLVGGGYLGTVVTVLFVIGVVAAAFSSADSAITALTTSVCVDILPTVDERKELCQATENGNAEIRRRKIVHVCVAMAFLLCIVAFRIIDSTNVINAIYVMAGYTYGPLLGLFIFGLFCQQQIRDKYVPIVALLSPILCALLDHYAPIWWGYTFGYELLMLNGLLTIVGLLALRKRTTTLSQHF